MKSKKNITIYDIATLAGVSPATVSNVINGKGKCSPEKKQEILNIMKETGFTPNVYARKLSADKRYILALNSANTESVDDEPQDRPSIEYRDQFLLGVRQAAYRYDCDVMLTESLSYDGVIFDYMPPYLDNLLEQNMPFVYAGPSKSEATAGHSVYGGSNEYYQKVLQVFHNKKASNIALFLCVLALPFNMNFRDTQLYNTIQDFCDSYGFSKENIHIFYYDESDTEQFSFLLDSVLKEKKRPDALFFATASAAITAYNYIQKSGLHIPKDIRMIATTFDTSTGKEFLPALSTIYVDAFHMGYRAVELLLHQLNSEKYPEKDSNVPFRYLERDSV